MRSKVTPSDIFDIDKKTGALILGKNRLDDYATKYLTKYCVAALTTPMPLPIEEILCKAGLTVIEASLSANLDVFGCCMLLDGDLKIYDKEKGCSQTISYPAGTILIDPDSEKMYGKGSRRNTLIHEALHWEKDRTYFKILEIKNAGTSEKLYPIMCRHSQMFYEPPHGKKTKENEIERMEWQARRLAPRVLMPQKMFKKKALELIDNNTCSFCDTLIEALSAFFVVSRISVKYRLLEVGLKDRLTAFEDYEAVFAEVNDSRDYVPLTFVESYKMLEQNVSLRAWIGKGHFVFADGYFTLADKEYITVAEDGLHLTEKAKKNLAQCVINIREQRYTHYKNREKDLTGFATLYRTDANIGEIDARLLVFHPNFQVNFDYTPEEAYQQYYEHILLPDRNEEIELEKMLGDPTTSLCQCLWYLMSNKKWYPSIFAEKTWLHENYYGKIKNDKYNNMGTGVLMAICVGLQLSLRMTEKLFTKSENKLKYYVDPDKTYLTILEYSSGISISDFNGICKAANIQQLGTTSKDDE